MDPQNNQTQGQDDSMKSYPFGGSKNNTVMAVLSYIGPLVIISYLAGKDDPFVRFHAKQGMIVFGLEIIIWVLGSMMYGLWMIMNLLNLATLILSIIGIINAVNGNQKELPVIGGFAKNINF